MLCLYDSEIDADSFDKRLEVKQEKVIRSGNNKEMKQTEVMTLGTSSSMWKKQNSPKISKPYAMDIGANELAPRTEGHYLIGVR